MTSTRELMIGPSIICVKVTFDECVGRNYREKLAREQVGGGTGHKCMGGDNTCDCDPTKLWLQVPWFCGHFQKCWSPLGNSWAQQQAKNNIMNKVVRNIKDYGESIEVIDEIILKFYLNINFRLYFPFS